MTDADAINSKVADLEEIIVRSLFECAAELFSEARPWDERRERVLAWKRGELALHFDAWGLSVVHVAHFEPPREGRGPVVPTDQARKDDDG